MLHNKHLEFYQLDQFTQCMNKWAHREEYILYKQIMLQEFQRNYF